MIFRASGTLPAQSCSDPIGKWWTIRLTTFALDEAAMGAADHALAQEKRLRNVTMVSAGVATVLSLVSLSLLIAAAVVARKR